MLVFGKYGMKIGNSGKTKHRYKQSLEAALVPTLPEASDEVRRTNLTLGILHELQGKVYPTKVYL